MAGFNNGMAHDSTDEDQWIAVTGEAISRFGALRILVNNAGLGHGDRLTDTTLEEWRTVMAVNLDGVFLGTKHAIPASVASGNGSIINISSVGSIMSAPLRVPNRASKGGVQSFTKAAAMECCEFGEPVRIDSVHLGPVAINIFAEAGEFDRSSQHSDEGGCKDISQVRCEYAEVATFSRSSPCLAA